MRVRSGLQCREGKLLTLVYCTDSALCALTLSCVSDTGLDGGLCVYSTARMYLPVQYLAPAAAIEGNISVEASPPRASDCVHVHSAGELDT